MKITDVKPFVLSNGTRNFTFVKVETDAGIYEVGEGGLSLRGHACAEVVRTMAVDLIGQDASRIEYLW